MTYNRKGVVLVIRPVDEICNLSCTYCNSEVYGHSKPKMKIDTLEEIISQASKLDYHFIRFTWHGGEPLVAGLPFFRKVIELQKKYLGGDFYLKKCENVIQTNGLLLNNDFIDFLFENNFHIAFSLDGHNTYTNHYRFPLNKAEKLFNETIKVWRKIKEKGIPLNVFCVVHDRNINFPTEIYSFFKQNNVDGISFNPRFLKSEKNENISSTAYVNFLKIITELRNSDIENGLFAPRLGMIDFLIGHRNSNNYCYLHGMCNSFININSKGEIFATCSDFLGIKIGDTSNSDLVPVIEKSLIGYNTEVSKLLGQSDNSNNGKLTGCPKYSHGTKDIYIDDLIALGRQFKEKVN